MDDYPGSIGASGSNIAEIRIRELKAERLLGGYRLEVIVDGQTWEGSRSPWKASSHVLSLAGSLRAGSRRGNPPVLASARVERGLPVEAPERERKRLHLQVVIDLRGEQVEALEALRDGGPVLLGLELRGVALLGQRLDEVHLQLQHLVEREQWVDLLREMQVVRRRLLVASVYIASFEVLKTTVVGRLRDFFSLGHTGDGDAPRYRDAVLRLHPRYRLQANLIWLANEGAIDEADMDAFHRARQLRNRLAHELIACAGQWPEELDGDAFERLVQLLLKIERWWILNVDVAVDPAFDGVEVDAEQVMPGSVMTLRLLRDLALAPDDKAGAYLAAFKEVMAALRG